MKLTLIHSAVLSIFTAFITYSQVVEDKKEFPAVPAGPMIEPTKTQTDKWNSFQAAHGTSWQLRWSDKTGVPASLLGLPIEVAEGSSEEVAKQFLMQNSTLFDMKELLSDFKVKKVEERIRANHVTFEQFYHGIRVEGGVYAVHLTKDKKVYLASGEYFKDVSLTTLSPAVKLTQAIDIAKQDLGANLILQSSPSGELVILPYGAEFRLCWKVNVSAKEPLGIWNYFVSASDGSVLAGYNSIDYTNATGSVYDRHPEAGAVVNRTLEYLLGNGYYLDGTYVKSINEDSDEAYEPDLTYIYDPNNTHFDEVMAYYHFNRFQKYLIDNLQYQLPVKVVATVHYGTNYANAFAKHDMSGNSDSLFFGDGNGTTYNDFAKENDIIYHEYQHLVTDCITYTGLDGDNFETLAMDEAFSDYFACSYAASPLYGEYIKAGSGSERNLQNTYKMSDGGAPGLPLQGYHNFSQVFSGALWDMRQDALIGQTNTDILAFEGLDNLDQALPEYIDGYEAILAADYALYGGAHVSRIQDIFASREIIWKGSITQTKTWRGKIYVISSVTVESGGTLTIQLSYGQIANVYFYPGTSLIVNGVVNAQGNSAHQVLFTSVSGATPGSWNYVLVQNGNSIFKYCTFQYGVRGLYLYNASSGNPTVIENCIFQNNSWHGLSLYGSKAKVKSCEMKNNQYGVYCYNNLDVKFIGNTIQNNSYMGVYSSSSNLLEFFGNVIQFNTGHGLSTANANVIHLGVPYSWESFNTIRSNSGHEVVAGSGNSTIWMVSCSIHDSILPPPFYEVYNTAGNPQIYTTHCYWDANGCQSSGSVAVNDPQNSRPTWDGQPRTAGSPIGKVYAPQPTDSIPWIVDPRIPDEEKIKRCKEIIAKKFESAEGKEALIWLYSIIRTDYVEDRLGEKRGFADYLQEIRNKSGDTETGKLALSYMIIWKMLENDNAAVVNLSNEALKVMTGEEKKWVLVDLALTYAHSGQIQEAKNTLGELELKDSLDEQLSALIENDIGDVEWQIAKGLWKPDQSAQPPQPETAKPLSVGLSQNYPNPFNPVTMIVYRITRPGKVSLKIFDVLGREVATLVNSERTEAVYTERFDASHLTSGIYFYQLIAPGVNETRKMLIAK
jgi:parallel beta-helix repeat protein